MGLGEQTIYFALSLNYNMRQIFTILYFGIDACHMTGYSGILERKSIEKFEKKLLSCLVIFCMFETGSRPCNNGKTLEKILWKAMKLMHGILELAA